jgi:3-phosphoshikimate 1-carboxyvinyltransferase
MGAKFDGSQLPLTITGTNDGSPIDYCSEVSSGQVKSAVLLAALNVRGTTTYTEPQRSRDHTERMLGHLGASISVSGNTVRLTGPFSPNGFRFVIPGDPSSCAFLASVAACVPDSFILFHDVLLNPLRLGFFRLLQKVGAALSFAPKEERFGETVGNLWVGSAPTLRPFEVSAQDGPALVDEAPLACLVATQCSGRSKFSGLAELKVKESNRLEETAKILSQYGARVELTEDGWIVEGPTSLKGANIMGQNDHRMVMLAACAALMAEGSSVIENPEVVSVSYPGFWEDLEQHVEV